MSCRLPSKRPKREYQQQFVCSVTSRGEATREVDLSAKERAARPEIRLHTAYDGYPQVLPTASGKPMTVVIDATNAAAFQPLWGMSLLERNVRLVERLGAQHIHLLVHPEEHLRAGQRRFPGLRALEIHLIGTDPVSFLRQLVECAPGPVLLLEGQVVYDRRLVAALWQCPAPAAVAGGKDGVDSAVLLADASSSPLLAGDGWDGLGRGFLAAENLHQLISGEVAAHISLLRKTIAPQGIRVEDQGSLRRADAYLKDLAGKGVNDLMAEFVHPPIEFFLTRLVARTRITPNQVSYFNTLLNVGAIPLIALGWLWTGIALNLLRGVFDGVDGKLARLTLRESKSGDSIDHVVDRLYLPVFFLALGLHLGGGDWTSRPALVSYLLQSFYWANSLLASWFSYFVGASIGEFRPIDRLVRRIWPKRNICVLLLLVSMLFNSPLYGLYAMTWLSGFMVLYRVVRLEQEGRRLRSERARATEKGSSP